ncbi:orotate phosphoribosyltransferase [Parvularcula sp. IMCC14364]|uniref:orotate phosphoribosyltransferase n=1 Tax=Parvularcula sp. IMCC14364 TaxID=3067902 RepID=UPI003555FA63
MTTDDVLEEFRACGALLKGHFILSSGRHSDTYLNKSIVSMYPDRTERLCKALAEKATAELSGAPQFIISPAMGGIIYGYETARAMKVPFMYTERVDGEFQLRRGFSVPDKAPVLIVEDIISTGLSARECVDAVRANGGDPLAVACLIDRSNGAADIGVPILSLAALDVQSWAADELPSHLADVPAVKPGSRGLA